MDEECKPKVYKSEGDQKVDIVIDDKAEVSRMADNIVTLNGATGGPTKTAESARKSSDRRGGHEPPVAKPTGTLPSRGHVAPGPAAPPSSAAPPLPSATGHSRPQQPFPLTIGCDGRYKTAFNPVSPSYAANMHSQAQFLQQMAVQRYYNEFLNGRCAPFVGAQAPHVPLGSPDFGCSPGQLSPFNSAANIYAAAAANSWLSAFHLDQQAKSAAAVGFGYHAPPLLWGLPHAQTSPIFMQPVDPIHHHLGSLSAGSFFNASPLHSPDTGSLIAPTGVALHHAPLLSLASLKLSAPSGTHPGTLLNGPCLNAPAARPPANPVNGLHHPTSSPTNHLRAIGQFLVHPTAQNMANSFAASLSSVCNSESANRLPHNQGTSNSHSHKQREQSVCRSLCKNGAATTSGSNCLPPKLCKFGVNGTAGLTSGSTPSTSYCTTNAGSAGVNCRKQLQAQAQALKRQQHIKKPLNAFMLYMKEMRPSVMQEAGLKERQSAEINSTLGRRWHSLTRDEQQKYYDLSKKERQEHLRKYPTWSARDNYAVHKKKKRKRDKTQDNLEAKKCRARFGLDQQSKWCKHCRRKKKCLWFKETDSGNETFDTSPPAQVSSTSYCDDEISPPFANEMCDRPATLPPASTSRLNPSTLCFSDSHASNHTLSVKVEERCIDEQSPPGTVSSTTPSSSAARRDADRDTVGDTPPSSSSCLVAVVSDEDDEAETRMTTSCDDEDDDDDDISSFDGGGHIDDEAMGGDSSGGVSPVLNCAVGKNMKLEKCGGQSLTRGGV